MLRSWKMEALNCALSQHKWLYYEHFRSLFLWSTETVSNACWFSHEIFISSRKRECQTKPPPKKLIEAKFLPTGWRSNSQYVKSKRLFGFPLVLQNRTCFYFIFYTSTCLREGPCICGGRLYMKQCSVSSPLQYQGTAGSSQGGSCNSLKTPPSP